MAKKRIVIIGAGLAGLSAAWHLQKRGIGCKVFEKEPEAGGLCRSKKIEGFTFDCDGHLLHFRNKYTLNLIKKILKVNIVRHKRSSWVYSFGRYIPYPFQASLSFLPPKIAAECLKGLIKADQNFLSGKNINFLSWINNAFGSGIARNFMVPYNKKFWRFPLHKINCEWVDSFIPRPTLAEVLENYFAQGRHSFGYNSSFWYPDKGGINQLPQAFEKQVCNVNKNCRVSAIDLKKKELILGCKSRENFDILISTMPLPELTRIAGVPRGILKMSALFRWNSILNINLGLRGICQTGKHWVYFPDKRNIFFRVGFFHNFTRKTHLRNRSSLYAEVSYRNNKQMRKEEVLTSVLKGLKETGLINSRQSVIAQDINDIKYGYPIYDINYPLARKGIMDFLLKQGVIPCGRYGSWRYMSMEDAILDGKSAAENIQLFF